MTNTTVLYQHGTLALLVPGLLAGTLTMGELLQHGDTGIGTGEGLDGELIILDGTPYQVDSAGRVNVVADAFTLPFANSHFAAYKPLMTVIAATRSAVEKQILATAEQPNIFFSVKLTGTFTDVTTRAVAKSQPPYDSLAETARHQSIFKRKQVEGTLLSYYAPQLFDGVAVGGFHYHFLSADHDFGGHLLEFGQASGTVMIQTFATLEQHFPVADAAYQHHDFSQDNIMADLHQAEG